MKFMYFTNKFKENIRFIEAGFTPSFWWFSRPYDHINIYYSCYDNNIRNFERKKLKFYRTRSYKDKKETVIYECDRIYKEVLDELKDYINKIERKTWN